MSKALAVDNYDSAKDTSDHIAVVRDLMALVIEDLEERASSHDDSKFSPQEKEFFDRFTPLLKTSTYGSDEYKRFLAEMKPALDHHYENNRHHPEHFCWHCPVCNWQGNNADCEQAPQGPNDSGVRYCPRCCRHGMLYESELMLRPEFGISGMNLIDLIEMLCDWKAATIRHNDGDIRKSIAINQKRFGYSDEMKRFMLNTVESFGW